MSNAIRYDALLVRALASELDERLRGARVARGWLDRKERLLALELGERRRPRTLSWSLQPALGQIALREGVAAQHGALLQIPPGARITAVNAPPDERIVHIRLESEGVAAGLVRVVVIELLGNRRNALALADGELISATLLQRAEPARELRAGVRYQPPGRTIRRGIDGPPTEIEWCDLLEGVAPTLRARALMSAFAWLSPINIAYVLGDAALPEAGHHVLAESHARYLELTRAPPRPCLLPDGQPYVHPLGTAAGERPTLLAAFEQAGTRSLPALGREALVELVRARLHERQERLAARIVRLEREGTDAQREAAALRHEAAVLLAKLQEVPRGQSAVELTSFDGSPVRIALDPALTPQQNAQRRYEQAKRRERAAARVPRLLEHAAAEAAELAALGARLSAAALSDAQIEDWARRTERTTAAASLPYRRYRTSSGLEVRVGRNSRANDALTSQHSSPEDIWLHARGVGGAHVILRWGRRAANPPRADLAEAAILAAVHSRSRTSGVVAVDWTRRKHVRKPRKAPPGLVVPERVQTLFVEPSSALEQRLRAEEDD